MECELYYALLFGQGVEGEVCTTEERVMATSATEEIRELVQRDIDEVWNEGNYEIIDELYAEDFVHHDPAYPGEIQGREAQKEFVRMYNTAFPGEPAITIDELVVEGDMVTLRWTGRGTHENEFMGVEPTHREVEVAGMSMARVRDGEIAEMWSNYDALGLLSQIGAVEFA